MSAINSKQLARMLHRRSGSGIHQLMKGSGWKATVSVSTRSGRSGTAARRTCRSAASTVSGAAVRMLGAVMWGSSFSTGGGRRIGSFEDGPHGDPRTGPAPAQVAGGHRRPDEDRAEQDRHRPVGRGDADAGGNFGEGVPERPEKGDGRRAERAERDGRTAMAGCHR